MLYHGVREMLKFGRGKSGSSSAPPHLDWESWMDCMLTLTLALGGGEGLETFFSTERHRIDRIDHIAILISCSGDILASLPHISLVSSYTTSMRLGAGQQSLRKMRNVHLTCKYYNHSCCEHWSFCAGLSACYQSS